MQISPTIQIPGRAVVQNRSRRVQSLTAPRAQSLQDPSFLRDKHVIRSVTHHEGVLEISLDDKDSLWAPRLCVLSVGQFSFESMQHSHAPLPHGQTFNDDKSFGCVPLEMVATVRTVRRTHNAFSLVLVDGRALTFKAGDKTNYQEWLFFFHSSIIAVAERMRMSRSSGLPRSQASDTISFRAWRGNLGGSASFLSPEEKEKARLHPSPPNSDFRRMPTRDKSWSSDAHQLPSQSLQSSPAWIPPPRSPVSSRSRSQSTASAGSGGASSLLSGSLGYGHGHTYFEGRPKKHSPTVSSSSCSPTIQLDSLGTSPSKSPVFRSTPQEGGILSRTSTIQYPGSGLSQSLKSRLPTPPPVSMALNGTLSYEEGHSPPLYGSPPRRFDRGDRGDSNGSLDINGLQDNGIADIINVDMHNSRTSSGSSSRRVSVDGGVFDLSLEEGDMQTFPYSDASQKLLTKLQPLSSPTDGQPPIPLTTPHLVTSISPVTTPVKEARTLQTPPPKKCSKWHSAAYCARGVRPKNEDTYYISDDAAGGRGYSSVRPSFPNGSGGGGPRGEISQDGTTSHGLGGGMGRSKWQEKKASKTGGDVPVGFYGVYDGHCGKEAAEMLATELHRDVFSEIGNLVDSQPPISDTLKDARIQNRAEALTKAFLALDTRYLDRAREENLYSGSTAVVALVAEGGKKVIVANLGDSGAVLVRRSDEQPESVKHSNLTHLSPSNMKEGDNESEDESSFTLGVTELTTEISDDSNTSVLSYTSLHMHRQAENSEKDEWVNALEAEGNFDAVQLSDDHKPNRPDEQERIEAARGWVTEEEELFMGQLQMMDLDDPFLVSKGPEKVVKWVTISRVCQELAVSRAFGDPDFKGFGPNSHTQPPQDLFFPFPDDHCRSFSEDLVLATPEVREHTLEEGDDFLVLATDGLWDVLSPQEVCQAIRRFKVRYQLGAEEGDREALCLHLAQELTNLALRLGSADNITVTVVAFEYA